MMQTGLLLSLLLTILFVTQSEMALKLPKDVTHSSKKHRAPQPPTSNDRNSTQTGVSDTDRRTKALNQDLNGPGHSLWEPNQLPPPGDPILLPDPTTRAVAGAVREPWCELVVHRLSISLPGCRTKVVETAKCYGQCASYAALVPPQRRRTRNHLFKYECGCCQTTGTRDISVLLECPALEQTRKKVRITKPTGCQCLRCSWRLSCNQVLRWRLQRSWSDV